MIYFLVNNNFHLIDAEQNLKNLKNYPTALISIPYKLTVSPTHAFDLKMEFPKLIGGITDYFYLVRTFLLHKKVKKELGNIQSNDVLIFYTEYEYLTHFIVNLFKEKGAKVILIEEGLLTYETFTSISDSKLNIKEKILRWYLKYVLGYFRTKIVKISNRVVTQLEDNQIDILLLYKKIDIKRNILIGQLATEKKEFINVSDNSALFLNEPMYLVYTTLEEYLDIIDHVLANLVANFEFVYFKFHPREKERDREIIQKNIKKHPSVKVIEDDNPVELIINQVGAKYVVSFAAQTLLYLSNSNNIPIYTFHLYPKLMKNQVLQHDKQILEDIGYTFMRDWQEIKNKDIGFKAQPEQINKTLQDYL